MDRIGRHLHGDADTDAPGILIRHAGGYDAFTWIAFAGQRHRVFARLTALSGARKGDQALDVGCGTGYFTRMIAEAVGPEGTAVGVDPSKDVIERARRITQLPNCTFTEGDAAALVAPSGTYDVVVNSLMIHHLPHEVRAQAVREMFRVLRPSGRLLIADFRPPASRIGRHLVGALTGPEMADNRIDLIESMIREAGFARWRSGDLHPWIHCVGAQKPPAA